MSARNLAEVKGPVAIYLNLGCGKRPLDGFINMDVEAPADILGNAARGLPFANSSVAGVYSEHFIEHLGQAQGARLLRECRRVLAPGGRLRIATPDLDYLVERYQSSWRDQSWLAQFGYEWIHNRCEMLNISMREWGHQWLYTEEELARLARYAGLSFMGRRAMGQSEEAMFRGREYRDDSRLILEFVKEKRRNLARPLVSVLIPAFNPKYFASCLESALEQSYGTLEIVVADDCPTDDVQAIVREQDDGRIRYLRNSPTKGSYENYIYCFDQARGEYIKFLNDDDVLRPSCVERMVACLQRYPDVTLVTSHRQRIDQDGNVLPDLRATSRLVSRDSIFAGEAMASALVSSRSNFVGEPSTVMFRREDMASSEPHILAFGDRAVAFNVDVAMWLTLLGKGDAIYIADTLSEFRSHAEQIQLRPGAREQALAAWNQMAFDARRFGFAVRSGEVRLSPRPALTAFG